MDTAPLWRREPYRLLFAEALVLAWAGVLPWLAYALRAAAYRAEYHAFAQIEGFLACIAMGFLFTFIPRRTGAAPASSFTIGAAAAGPAGIAACAWFGATALSQALWLVLVAVVLAFAMRRLFARGAGRELPNAIVWVPAGLLFGAAGAMLLIAGDAGTTPLARAVGRGLVLQGLLSSLIAGIGATLLPVLTRGEPHARTAGTARDAAAKATHAVGAVLLGASFAIEATGSPRAGYALRAAVVLAALLASARIHRPPTVPGLHRRLVWIAAWLLPLGFALAAAFPTYDQAALHVVFIGGFALMALSVAVHVALAHAGRPWLLSRSPWRVGGMGAFLIASLVVRVGADVDPAHRRSWLGAAAALFLAGTVSWAALVLPRLWEAGPEERA